MTESKSEHRLQLAFDIGLIIKGLDGLLEFIGGIILLLVSPALLNNLATTLTYHELSTDPHDFIANHILHSAGRLTHASVIAGGIYLLIHGISKLVLVVAVYKNRIWAFPWMIGLLALFVVYQVYRIGLHGSVSLTLLTVFDIVMIWLTWHEYQRRLRLIP